VIVGAVLVYGRRQDRRPEEVFGGDWRDVDIDARVFTVRRAFAKGRLKSHGKTAWSQRRLSLRAKVIEALKELPRRDGILSPRPWAVASISTTSARVNGRRRLRPRASSIAASTTCVTPSRPGASRPT
jgi:integrase